MGDITLDSAAFGRGRVTDAWGDPIDDKTVYFYTRRIDKGPRWVLGGWRVKGDGSFLSKIAPKTWFRFYTRFWNNRWENKYQVEDYEFSLGETIDLGDVTIGETALVEMRAVSSMVDASENAAPIADVRVDIFDAETNKVYDWRRTDGEGECQLRAPFGRPLKMRLQFYTWANFFGGLGFLKLTSEFFKPQVSEEFTLEADVTDFGDVFVTAHLRFYLEKLIRRTTALPDSAFGGPGLRRNILRIAWLAALTTSAIGQEMDTDAAKMLLENGVNLMSIVIANIEIGIVDPEAREKALRFAFAGLDDFGIQLDSMEN